MTVKIVPRDDNKEAAFGWDEEEQVFKVALMVWDTNTLDWVRMQQPSLEADTANLYVALDEVESLLGKILMGNQGTAYTLGYDGSDRISTITRGLDSKVMTFSYTGDLLTGISDWA